MLVEGLHVAAVLRRTVLLGRCFMHASGHQYRRYGYPDA